MALDSRVLAKRNGSSLWQSRLAGRETRIRNFLQTARLCCNLRQHESIALRKALSVLSLGERNAHRPISYSVLDLIRCAHRLMIGRYSTAIRLTFGRQKGDGASDPLAPCHGKSNPDCFSLPAGRYSTGASILIDETNALKRPFEQLNRSLLSPSAHLHLDELA